jgi:adiponectin receptor
METDPIMPVERRTQAQRPTKIYTSNGTALASTPTSNRNLLSYSESLKQVPWQTDNDHILSGYRRQLPTIGACLRSAFACELALASIGF